MAQQHVIAVDLGASNGRVMQVGFDGERLSLQALHRFPNVPVQANGTLYWDALRLWHEVITGLGQIPGDAASIGVDAWGVDFALLDRDGGLVANPVHYRDRRTDAMPEWVFARVPRRTVFERTGIQFMPINTLFQLASLAAANSPQLDCAATFVTLPGLFNFWLTGSREAEFTAATTTQFYSPHRDDWDFETLETLGIPTGIFPPIVPPGTTIGAYRGVPVIAPATHDTGSAAAAVPDVTGNAAFLSSGTWSLLGIETPDVLINDAVFDANITNEGGVYGTNRLLKNVMGLWLEQSCRAVWRSEGRPDDFGVLIAAAEAAEPFRSLIVPGDPVFLPPGDMPGRVRTFCRETGQPAPETVGQVLRTIYESLALEYRRVLNRLVMLVGHEVERLHVIGGGSQNQMLCQLTANAIGRPVVAGPVEATALGNALVQLITLGSMADLAEGRRVIAASFETPVYDPRDQARWDDAYERYLALMAQVGVTW